MGAPSDEGRRGLRPATLVGLWLMFAGLGGLAYYGLPPYMASLDARIVFRSPDCMDVAREQATSDVLPVEERGDSLEVWMKDCMAERQQEMARHADFVGFGVMGGLLLLSVLLTALTIQSAWLRLGP